MYIYTYIYIYIYTHIHTHTHIYMIITEPQKRIKYAICNNMDELGGIMLSEISQTKTNNICYHSYVESKK